MNEQTRSQIKKITIYTKRLAQSTLTGDYLSAFKGTGLEFEQLREYHIGDDIRFIDWKSTARRNHSESMNKIMVKEFVEERDRTIIIAIDTSSSTIYSSNSELRSATIAQVATVLAFIATHNKDKVGALFFSDKIEKWIPPKRGMAHYNTIIKQLFEPAENGHARTTKKQTNINEALRFLISLKKRNAIVFGLSDWIDSTKRYTKLLKVASIKFDFIAIRFLDIHEQVLPEFGFLDIEDPETGEQITVDTTAKINVFLRARKLEQERMFTKYKINLLDLPVGQPFVSRMITFFHKRTRRQI